MAVRPAAVGRPRRAVDLALAASPAGRTGSGGTPWGGVVDGLLGLGTAFLGPACRVVGQRFSVMGKPGSQILGEALVIGVVLGWQAVVVLVPLALFLEELSRHRGAPLDVARRFVAAVWIAPLTLLWILNWALACWVVARCGAPVG